MKRYLDKKTERVVEILGSEFTTHKFIFGKASRIDVETVMAGAMNGKVEPFVTAHATADRTSDYIKVNVSRVPAYKVAHKPLPAPVLALIAKIPSLQEPGKEEELESLIAEIDNYFQLD